MARLSKFFGAATLVLLLASCQSFDLSQVKLSTMGIFDVNGKGNVGAVDEDRGNRNEDEISIKKLINAETKINVNSGVSAAIKDAVTLDPSIVAAKSDLAAARASVNAIASRKDFQVSGNVYGGVEDLTDENAGIAISVSASKILIDGGKLEASAAAQSYRAESSLHLLRGKLNDRAADMINLWIELERYTNLNSLILKRVAVLDPLIEQLQEVSEAGVGDVSKVAAAERTVSMVRVKQAKISERLDQARLSFTSAFGGLPSEVAFDHNFISTRVPSNISEDMVENVPALKSEMALLRAAQADLEVARTKDKMNLSFDARASRPFAGSDSDSDEQFGLVLNKTLYNGGVKDAEVLKATAQVDAASGRISSTFKEGKQVIDLVYQSISSTNEAILLAKDNASATYEEIVYLRRQLVIGASTLDQVLAAEARLYEAEAQEINFLAELRKSQTLVLSKLGLLASEVGLTVD